MKPAEQPGVGYTRVSMLTRVAALAAVLTLFGADAVPCAGWEATADARHDCCVEGRCPDEVSSGSAHSGSHGGPMTQADADRCCAASEQKHQQRNSQFADSSFALSPPAEAPRFDSMLAFVPARIERDPAPEPSPPTRLHVRFSVFLV